MASASHDSPSKAPAPAPLELVETKRRERLICSVCFEVFRQPKLLPCHHSLCLQCLHQLIAHNTATTLACPQCRSQVVVPAGGADAFQTNFYILPEDLEAAKRVGTSGGVGGDVAASSSDVKARVRGDINATTDTENDWMIAVVVASDEVSDSTEQQSGQRTVQERRTRTGELERERREEREARERERRTEDMLRSVVQLHKCQHYTRMTFVAIVCIGLALFIWWLAAQVFGAPFPFWSSGEEDNDGDKETDGT